MNVSLDHYWNITKTGKQKSQCLAPSNKLFLSIITSCWLLNILKTSDLLLSNFRHSLCKSGVATSDQRLCHTKEKERNIIL